MGLRAFDLNPRVRSEFATRTSAGGLVTLLSAVSMAYLFLSELRAYLYPPTANSLAVDTVPLRDAALRINLDVTFHRMGCAIVTLDAMDVTGNAHLDVAHSVYKRRLDARGEPIAQAERHALGGSMHDGDGREREALNEEGEGEDKCGSCYGAEEREGDCCNTCEDVREAYRRKGWAFKNADSMVQCAREGFTAKLHAQEGEGCRVSGYLDVNRVAGNFHFAPGKAFDRGGVHVHDLQPFDTYDFDTSHTVHSLSFGEKYPGAQNPLDAEVVQMPALTPTGMYSYFLKVVPTEYEDKAGRVIDSNQFSFTRHYRAMKSIMGGGVPGVFFFYDLSPLRVHYVEERRSALHFLTSVLAILGGVFTVSGMVDGMVYHGSKAIAKKMELGKLS